MTKSLRINCCPHNHYASVINTMISETVPKGKWTSEYLVKEAGGCVIYQWLLYFTQNTPTLCTISLALQMDTCSNSVMPLLSVVAKSSCIDWKSLLNLAWQQELVMLYNSLRGGPYQAVVQVLKCNCDSWTAEWYLFKFYSKIRIGLRECKNQYFSVGGVIFWSCVW